MKRRSIFLVGVLAIVGAVGGGYWIGRGSLSEHGVVPKARQTPKGAPDAERKPLYYRNPMGLAGTSPVPKKDSMGMDYIPVYADEEDGGAILKIGPEKIQKLGVRTETVTSRSMTRSIRAVGTVAFDERRIATVNPKVEGWIEKLYVNATGQSVQKGGPLAEIYSPDLVLAEKEYLVARQALTSMAEASPPAREGAHMIAEAALARLRNWDISEDQLDKLARTGTVMRALTLHAADGGIVTDKPAIEGMRFAAGEALFRIADLSIVWVIADVFEQDLAMIGLGQEVRISVEAYPGRIFTGKVSFVYPTVNRETRTARLRIEISNPRQLLKPDMYATVELVAPASELPVIAVPVSAVLDSGKRQVVLVSRGEGTYEPRQVELGRRADGYVEALSGVAVGDEVVIGANFLIDAESNLRAALQSFAAPEGRNR